VLVGVAARAARGVYWKVALDTCIATGVLIVAGPRSDRLPFGTVFGRTENVVPSELGRGPGPDRRRGFGQVPSRTQGGRAGHRKYKERAAPGTARIPGKLVPLSQRVNGGNVR
jgi:hypothetical protein